MLNKSVFSDRLKDLRKRKGISQGEMAELIEVHFIQVSRYVRWETENKKTVPWLMDAYLAKTKIQSLLHTK